MNLSDGGVVPEVNHRQVGRTVRGRVTKSPKLFADPKARTPASIPSKFEATLSTGARESNAFGARTFRFHGHHTPVPGPGHYRPPALKLERQDGSVSRRGYTSGFASKAKRFSDADFLRDSSIPGPGQYSQVDKHKVHSYDPRKSQCTRVFVPPKPASPSRYPTPPGPGDYNTNTGEERGRAKHERSRKSATFQSDVRRFKLTPEAVELLSTPSVGKYDSNRGARFLERQGDIPLPLSSLRSGTARGADVICNRHALKNPGPGSYEAPAAYDNTRIDVHKRNRHACVFANVTTDRFGEPYEKKSDFAETPGPGWYGGEPAPESRAHSGPAPKPVKSPFISGTDRFKPPRKPFDRAPGPAFYHPSVAATSRGKKTFLLNATNRWV